MTKKVSPYVITILCFIILTTNICAADTKTGNWNFNETTGLVNMPTARTIEPCTVSLFIRIARLGKDAPLKKKSQTSDPGQHTGTIWDSDWWIDSNGDRGLLASPFKNIEFSLMNIHSYTLTPVVGAKWVFAEETDTMPALAAGAHNITSINENINVRNKEVRDANSKIAPFIVASKSFFEEDILDLSVGIGAGRFRNRVFYGGELFLDKNKVFSAVGEYDGNISSYGIKFCPYKSRWDFGIFMQDVDNPGFTVNYQIKY